MWILFGSNAGASHEFASQTAEAAKKVGFAANVTSLDQALQEQMWVPDGRIVVVVTSTYNGKPPDNAAKFKGWLASQPDGSLSGLRYAVFGWGNSQWQTYQQFPREVDSALARCGARQLHSLGACDVDGATFESDFEDWLAALLQAIGGASVSCGDAGQNSKQDETEHAFVLVEPDSFPGSELHTTISTVILQLEKDKVAYAKMCGEQAAAPFRAVKIAQESRELCQSATDRSVRHVTLQLPDGCSYRAGDHLEVLPPNGLELVRPVLEALGIDAFAPVKWTVTQGPRVKNNRSTRDGSHSADPIRYVTAELVVTWVPDLAAVPSRKVLSHQRLSQL